MRRKTLRCARSPRPAPSPDRRADAAHSLSTSLREHVERAFLDQDLDARLVDVVATAEAVVDAQDRRRGSSRISARGRNSRITWPMIGVRPEPPPTEHRKPSAPPRHRARAAAPMSWTRIAARSVVAARSRAILNLRGRYANSGWNVDHCRSSSAVRAGDRPISRRPTMPRKWSLVMLRMQLPRGLDRVHLHRSRAPRGCRGRASSCGQLNWMFWRVVKWP